MIMPSACYQGNLLHHLTVERKNALSGASKVISTKKKEILK
jgi:hypothetical protein